MRRVGDHPQQMTMDGSTRQQKLYDDAIQLLRMIADAPVTRETGGLYLATSFGKDSIVTQRLCDEAGVEYDAHHQHTGIDPPELVRFGQRYYPNVTRHYAGISMWNLIVKKGIPPMRHMRYCCDVLKEDGGSGRMCVMGIRACESTRRAKRWAPLAEYKVRGERKEDARRLFDPNDIQQVVQSCAMRGKWTVSPLFYWNDADLWEFIRDRKLPYCELYDQGFERLGCIGCPMAQEAGRERDFSRWPKYRAAYIRAFDRLIENGRFTNRGFTCGEDIMQWWMQDRIQRQSEDQISMW